MKLIKVSNIQWLFCCYFLFNDWTASFLPQTWNTNHIN